MNISDSVLYRSGNRALGKQTFSRFKVGKLLKSPKLPDIQILPWNSRDFEHRGAGLFDTIHTDVSMSVSVIFHFSVVDTFHTNNVMETDRIDFHVLH